jgi:DNA-binding CsgD family transcriptional regulator
MSTLVGRLDQVQLEIIMHLANGKQIDEIAILLHRSRSDITRRIANARKRTRTATLPHLVSIAIATGDLVWEDANAERTIASANGHATAR